MKTEVITFKNESYDLEFRLSIIDYQFPEIQSDYDGNWLVLKYECYYKDKIFVTEDPSLLAIDLVEIFEWFNSLSKNQIPKYVCLGFIEPNLEFEVYSNKKGVIRFGIRLSLEAKPPFFIEEFIVDDTKDDENDFVMVFEASYQELKVFRDHFKKISEQYPVRGTLY